MTNIIEIRNQLKELFNLEIIEGSQLFKILQLFYVRQVEEFISSMYQESTFRCPVHLSIGQEAIAVGVCSNLKREDKVISTHRSHAHYLAKGGDLASMFAEMMGKPSGCSLGRGGSMHLFDQKEGFFGSIPIVGSSLPIATGIAYAQKIGNKDQITVSFQGDAAFETGQFHESLNFVSSFNIPILIIMENNKYSTYSPIKDRQSLNMDLEKIVTGIGLKYSKLSGDNLLQIELEIPKIIGEVRQGTPRFVEFDTFRRLEHCGPNLDDDLGYRTTAEINSYIDRDPIYLVKSYFQKNESVSADFKIIESFLPKYIETIYQKTKNGSDEHELLSETDCYHTL
jgi:pyruvate dehydrogenase E1 component alpha subunit